MLLLEYQLKVLTVLEEKRKFKASNEIRLGSRQLLLKVLCFKTLLRAHYKICNTKLYISQNDFRSEANGYKLSVSDLNPQKQNTSRQRKK